MKQQSSGTELMCSAMDLKSSGMDLISSGIRLSPQGMDLVKSSMQLVEVYERHDDTTLEGILLAVTSSLIALGGAALLLFSSGTAAPLLGVAMVGPGISGTISASVATANNRFSLVDFMTDFSIEAGTSLITLGAGFGTAGGAAALLMTHTKISSEAIKSASTAAAALAGAGVRSGAYTVVVTAKGEPIGAVDLVFQGLAGAAEGATAGFLKVKTIARLNADPNPRLSVVTVESDAESVASGTSRFSVGSAAGSSNGESASLGSGITRQTEAFAQEANDAIARGQGQRFSIALPEAEAVAGVDPIHTPHRIVYTRGVKARIRKVEVFNRDGILLEEVHIYHERALQPPQPGMPPPVTKHGDIEGPHVHISKFTVRPSDGRVFPGKKDCKAMTAADLARFGLDLEGNVIPGGYIPT